MNQIRIHPDVLDALHSGRAVVALESAVITSGLPREAMNLPSGLEAPGWNSREPANLELGRGMQRAVRDAGAIPATVAVIRGILHIGLSDQELTQLATDSKAGKAASTDLAYIMAAGGSAGTTVSATLIACTLAQSKIQNPGGAKSKVVRSGVRVFATGGIGGVHRNWQQRPDISTDLRAIATTPVCVVCSGAKSILDLPATLESLETLGVPVIGYRTDCFPQFQCAPDAAMRLNKRVESAQTAATLCGIHWSGLRLPSGIILANPAPERFAMNAADLDHAVQQAESLASSQRISGAARTPFLLAELARLTDNRSLHANLALLINNARLAAELAIQLAAAPDIVHIDQH
jgi:pseudouridine-5'-phosphate glycosidase